MSLSQSADSMFILVTGEGKFVCVVSSLQMSKRISKMYLQGIASCQQLLVVAVFRVGADFCIIN